MGERFVYILEHLHSDEFVFGNRWNELESIAYQDAGYKEWSAYETAEQAWEAGLAIPKMHARAIERHGWNHDQTQYAIEWQDDGALCMRVREIPFNRRPFTPSTSRLVRLNDNDVRNGCAISPIEFPMSASRKNCIPNPISQLQKQ